MQDQVHIETIWIKYGCKGALDWEIEVLSPSTQRHDQFMKLILYHKAGAGVLGR